MSKLGGIAAAVLYNDDLLPPRGPRRLSVRANQFLFEQGIAPPWVWPADRCRDYWASQDEDSGVNRPSEYARKNRAIVGVLDSFWRPEVSEQMAVLEVGCNAGANL